MAMCVVQDSSFNNQAKKMVARIAAPNCTEMNALTSIGRIPANVLENALAMVTAGFAKEVDEVNQYAAVI